MKVLICSIPKAGTYLLGEILKELGMEDVHRHLSQGGYTDTGCAAFEELRKNPANYAVRTNPDNAIRTLKYNQFACTHCGPYLLPICNRTNTLPIFLKRDIRSGITSCCRWTLETGRWMDGDQSWRKAKTEVRIAQFMRRYRTRLTHLFQEAAKWEDVNGILKIRYEDLVFRQEDAGQRAVSSIATHIGRACNPDAVLRNALSVETLTKSRPGLPPTIYDWTEECENLFASFGLDRINGKLGYE